MSDTFSVGLLLVAVMAGLEAQGILRKGGPRRRQFGVMLAICTLTALAAFAGLKDSPDSTLARALGAVAMGGFVFLLLVPRLLRWLARLAARRRPNLTMRLLSAVELLQPGMGAREEQGALALFLEVRSGQPARALEALREARAAAHEPRLRRSIDERIVWALLASGHWQGATDHFERHIDGQPGPLGAALLVELLKAYGATGRLARVASLAEQIERSPIAEGAQMAPLLARARLSLLAITGQLGAVELMLGQRGALGAMPPPGRAYWLAVARHAAGDGEGARAAASDLEKAASRDPHVAGLLSVELTGLLARPTPQVPDDVADFARQVARKVERMDPVPVLGQADRRAPLTLTLIAVNVLVAVLLQLTIGSTSDPWGLLDAGANLSSATRDGEWWRLGSSTVIHAGLLHLAVNALALWSLGHLTERVFGVWRMLAVYLGAGLGGALVSAFGGGDRLSVGASGAIFGLVGAAIAELALHGKSYAPDWRKRLLGGLVWTALINLGFGLLVPAIDQLAHLGGLGTGFVLGALLSPSHRLGQAKAGRVIASAFAVALVGVVAASIVTAWRTSPLDTLRRLGTTSIERASAVLEVPRLWNDAALPAQVGAIYAADQRLIDEVVAEVHAAALSEAGLAAVADPSQPDWQPAGWHCREQVAEVAEEHLRFRLATCGRDRPDDLALGGLGKLVISVALPERYMPLFEGELARMISSAHPKGLP